jgi:hypothetical protein
MALYLIDTGAGRVLVRAGNGRDAQAFLGVAGAPVERVTEEGPDGLVAAVAVPLVGPADAAQETGPDDAAEWIDVSSLSTPRGKREEMHRDTGETRLVDRN